jgi:hypothetical protein
MSCRPPPLLYHHQGSLVNHCSLWMAENKVSFSLSFFLLLFSFSVALDFDLRGHNKRRPYLHCIKAHSICDDSTMAVSLHYESRSTSLSLAGFIAVNKFILLTPALATLQQSNQDPSPIGYYFQTARMDQAFDLFPILLFSTGIVSCWSDVVIGALHWLYFYLLECYLLPQKKYIS